MSFVDFVGAIGRALPVMPRATGISELTALDDRMLADVGLHRSASNWTPPRGNAQHQPDPGDLSFLLWW